MTLCLNPADKMNSFLVLFAVCVIASCSAFTMAPARAFRSSSSLMMADLTDTMKFKTIFRLKFSSLYGAIAAAGLEETLKGPGPFTSKNHC